MIREQPMWHFAVIVLIVIAICVWAERCDRKQQANWKRIDDRALMPTFVPLDVDVRGTFTIYSQSAEIIRMCWQTPVPCECRCPTRMP